MEILKGAITTNMAVTKISYKWIINNISWVYKMEEYHNLISPHFPEINNYKFLIKLNGSNSENLCISLRSTTSNNTEKMFKICILLADNKKNSSSVLHKFKSDFTFPPIKWAELFENKNEVLPDNNLIICCNIYMLKSPENHTKQFNEVQLPQSKLTENFATLLTKKEFNDVQIETSSGHKIPANKCILSARSKVFAAMFEHPTEENQKNCITISDFSSEVITEMLHFMYTDEAPNLEELAEDLIAAADKYGLERLKAMCARCLSKNLSVKNAALTFKLADLHNEGELRSESIEYIKMVSSQVAKTESWMNLVTTDKDLIISTFLESDLQKMKLDIDDI